MCKVHFVITDFKAERGLIENPVHPSYFTDEDTQPKEQVLSLSEVLHLLSGLKGPDTLVVALSTTPGVQCQFNPLPVETICQR